MRQIIFRGKRVDNGKLIYGWYIKANIHWHKYGVHKDWIVCNAIQNGGICNVIGRYAVITETVGQYTGLTDKNGNKIFEGDIVKGSWNTVFGVYFDEDYLQYRAKEKSGSHHEIDYYGESYRLEVIGNVYDNPELLEVKNETDKMPERKARRL